MASEFTNKVRVARIGKPHGIRGEVTVQIFTDSPHSRFQVGNTLKLKGNEGFSIPFKELTIEKSRWNKKILLLKFVEFSDRNTAEALRDLELYAPADHLDEEDYWYAEDLVDFSVYENTYESSPIGSVTNLITRGVQDLLEVQLVDGRNVLLPFVFEIVPEIDETRRAIVITPPPGLLELNQD